MRFYLATLLAVSLPTLAFAGPADFKTGPIIEGFGPVAAVTEAQVLPENAHFKIAFDTAKGSEGDVLNRTLESAARFINMHGAAGVAPDKINVAVVIHGGAAFDLLTTDGHKARRDGADNPNVALFDALTDAGVRIILCGQTAAYRDITKDSLLPNVELALSAMTAHAQLQQGGYTLNPF
jgi:intracellular sulfur oxidation DsrE/DsrF family protein